MYVLDTNVISELRRTRPNASVLRWLSATPPEQLFIAAVTFGELQAGVEMTRMQDRSKAEAIEEWIIGGDLIEPVPHDSTLKSFDDRP